MLFNWVRRADINVMSQYVSRGRHIITQSGVGTYQLYDVVTLIFVQET